MRQLSLTYPSMTMCGYVLVLYVYACMAECINLNLSCDFLLPSPLWWVLCLWMCLHWNMGRREELERNSGYCMSDTSYSHIWDLYLHRLMILKWLRQNRHKCVCVSICEDDAIAQLDVVCSHCNFEIIVPFFPPLHFIFSWKKEF